MLNFGISGEDFSKKVYNCAGRKIFLHRFADTGFKTKWCGIWAPPIKCFEYFAYKVNGTWLSADNQAKCLLKAWQGAKHIFSLDGMEAEELLYAPKSKSALVSLLLLKNTSHEKKDVYVEIEAAVNIRTKDENWHGRGYVAAFDEVREAVVFDSEKGCAMYGAGDAGKKISIEYVPEPYYKDHYPGEKQRCFVAGKYAVRLSLLPDEAVKLPFVYAGSHNSKSEMLDAFDFCAKNPEKLLEENVRTSVLLLHSQGIDTPDARLNKAFLWSQANLNALIHRSEYGEAVFAGYPWFLDFWGRDTLWSSLALLDSGDFASAASALRTLAGHYKERIPCTIDMYGQAKYYAADTDPLFLIALDRYTAATGDESMKKEMADVEKKILSHLEVLDYIVQHKPEETWMDSLKRNGSAVEIQSLWVEALKYRNPQLSALMKKRLDISYWNADAEFLFDSFGKLPDPAQTANALVPVMFGQMQKDKAAKILKNAGENFSTLYGIRTRSKLDREYKADGYHTGSVWGLTTGWAAAAYLASGMIPEGISCLGDMAEDLERRCGGMSECLNADTGELIGAPCMAWSHGMFLHAVDSYLFGIKANIPARAIRIEPKLPDGWDHMARHGKALGNLVMNVRMERISGGVRTQISFDRMPQGMKLELVLPPWVGSLEHDKKKFQGNRIEILPRQENIIIGRL